MVKSFKCALCNKHNLKEKNRRRISTNSLKTYVSSITKKEINYDDVICVKCRAQYLRDKVSTSSAPVFSNSQEDGNSNTTVGKKKNLFKSPKSIQLNFASTSNSHRRCFICKKESGKRHLLIVVPQEASTQAFIENCIVIPQNSRCCRNHLRDKHFDEQSLSDIKKVSDTTSFNRSDISDLLDRVRSVIKTSGKLNFDLPFSLSDNDYMNLTGLTHDQFNAVASNLKTIRNTEIRSARTCLAILLVKLRTGLSNTIIATLFSMKKHQVQRAVHAARSDLMANFVPKYLGFEHISHEDFVTNHTTPISKQIFCEGNEDTAVLVIDGTYIYIQKSANHQFQKLTYSLHKNRCLVKPMMIVGTDGYILDVLGPYYSNGANNDAAITKHALKTDEALFRSWLKPSDLFVVDRGFRDVIEFLQECDFQVEMPAFLKKGETQYTTENANTSRLVTKIRWVVESANGRLKQFRFLDKVVPNHYVPYIGDFVKIISSLINCFRAPLVSDLNEDNLGKEMLEKSKEQNHVKLIVEENNLLRKRSVYTEISGASELKDFPKISIDQLRVLTMGVYQVKLAPRYVEQHLSENEKFILFACKERENLVKIKIKSRHSSCKIYNLWLEYSSDEVTGWYCTCKVGARVVGCCCHIASVIWYLGFDRWVEKTLVEKRQHPTLLDASCIPSDDEDEVLSDDDSVVEE